MILRLLYLLISLRILHILSFELHHNHIHANHKATQHYRCDFHYNVHFVLLSQYLAHDFTYRPAHCQHMKHSRKTNRLCFDINFMLYDELEQTCHPSKTVRQLLKVFDILCAVFMRRLNIS